MFCHGQGKVTFSCQYNNIIIIKIGSQSLCFLGPDYKEKDRAKGKLAKKSVMLKLLKKQDAQFWGTLEVTKVISMFRGLKKNNSKYLNKTEAIKLKSGQETDEAPDTEIKPDAHAEHLRFFDDAMGTFCTEPSHSNAHVNDELSSILISVDEDDGGELRK